MSKSPRCCDRDARLTDGAEIYPHRSDLHSKPIWKCDGCGGHVGCHPGTTNALGTPATAELRQARMKLHNGRIDPLWRRAADNPAYEPESKRARAIITRTARRRVYAFLAAKLGFTKDECHVGMFDLATCRRAWAALDGVTYSDIRAWDKAQQAARAA